MLLDRDEMAALQRSVAGALFEEAFTEQRFDGVGRALRGEYQLHIGSTTLDLGPGDLEQLVADWHAAFTDFRFEIHHVVVDGGVAAVHATLHGVHSGPWRGKDPTGHQHSSAHMFFIRFEEDRIVEVWELNDPAGLP